MSLTGHVRQSVSDPMSLSQLSQLAYNRAEEIWGKQRIVEKGCRRAIEECSSATPLKWFYAWKMIG